MRRSSKGRSRRRRRRRKRRGNSGPPSLLAKTSEINIIRAQFCLLFHMICKKCVRGSPVEGAIMHSRWVGVPRKSPNFLCDKDESSPLKDGDE